MKGNRVWLFAIIIGIMIITTVCYITSVRNARTEFANGRVVFKEVGYENRNSIY